MTFREFCGEIQRTLPDLDETYDLISRGHDLPKDLLNQTHMRLGMVGEFDEIIDALAKNDTVGLGEEIADTLWYVGNDLLIKFKRGHIPEEILLSFTTCRFGVSLVEANNLRITTSVGRVSSFIEMVYHISKLVDLNKKDLAYGKSEGSVELVEKYCYEVGQLLWAINDFAIYCKIDLDHFMQKVVDKLRERYPDKFDAVRAVNRDVVKERQILEGQSTGNNDLATAAGIALASESISEQEKHSSPPHDGHSDHHHSTSHESHQISESHHSSGGESHNSVDSGSDYSSSSGLE